MMSKCGGSRDLQKGSASFKNIFKTNKDEESRKNNQQMRKRYQTDAMISNDKKQLKIDEKSDLEKLQWNMSATVLSSDKPVESDNESDDGEKFEKARSCKSFDKCNPFYSQLKKPKSCKFVAKTPSHTAVHQQKKALQKIFQQEFVNLPTDVIENICKFLSNDQILSLIYTDIRLASSISNSATNLLKFKLYINKHSISTILTNENLRTVRVKNLSIDCEGVTNNKGPLIVVNYFKTSVEHLELENMKFKSLDELNSLFGGLSNLKSFSLKKCSIDHRINKNLPAKSTLKNIYFDKCNDNIFKAFASQAYIEKMTIRNDDWTWNGFPHEIVNDMLFNCKNMKNLVLIGSGTGSFFDSDNFSFKLKKLDATMITFHWYVGIKNGRTSFLQTQKGALEELTIHKLPFDFDGGKVLKYTIEEMGLKTFYYGKIPLILNGKKQNVKEFEANEIQITSTLEMFRQFPSIKFFRFILSETDIASDEVEKNVNPTTTLFNNLEEFEVVDNSRYRGTLGVYLGLFKNIRNIRKLTLKTQDRNINTLLEEFLRHMSHLNEIYITSKTPRVTERFQIINRFVPNLTKISVAPQFLEEAKKTFRNVEVCETIEQ